MTLRHTQRTKLIDTDTHCSITIKTIATICNTVADK